MWKGKTNKQNKTKTTKNQTAIVDQHIGDVYAQANMWNQHCRKGREAICVFMKWLSLCCVFLKRFNKFIMSGMVQYPVNIDIQ